MKKAFTSCHLDSFHPELVSGYTTYQNWQKLPPPGGRAGVRGQQALTKTFTLCHLEQSEKSQKAPAKAFTLAEVLITLAIIGVVAAISIPSVISNAQQQEFKTGLRKAVSVLNSAITMNIALDGESPYDNHDLFRYLQRHMSVISSTTVLPYWYYVYKSNGDAFGLSGWAEGGNSAFYTTDGMRFEFHSAADYCSSTATSYRVASMSSPLHESAEKPHICTTVRNGEINPNFKCGSYGLANNPNNLAATPCMIMVDVNGDRKPFPVNVNCQEYSCCFKNRLQVPMWNSKTVKDTFSIIVTEDRAIPYGVLAQKAMYQAQK